MPTRSVPQLRKLIAADAQLGAKIARISDRTVYRFLAHHGLTKSARYLMLADDARTSFRSFEAPHTLALVQADARDGIWLDTPGGRKKTYLFLWLDDFSRKILFGKYYFDEKLPALLDSFRYCLLRYGIPCASTSTAAKSTSPATCSPSWSNCTSSGCATRPIRPTARARSRPPTRSSRTSSNARRRSPASAPSTS